MSATVLYRVEVRDVPAMVVGTIRGCVPVEPVATLDTWIINAIRELFRCLAAQRIRPTGVPFAMLPPPEGRQPLPIAVALPALRRVSARERVEPDTIPACRALATRHHGPWSELVSAYHALWRLIEEHQLEPAGEPREVYLTNPLETPPEEWETELLWPISVAADWDLPDLRSTRSFARG